MEYIPYTYLIGWSNLNLWYYGVRYANNKNNIANPNDLFVTYFTSSKLVKEIRKIYGEPDIIKIRRTFSTSVQAIEWENKVLTKIDAKNNPKFLNQMNSYLLFVGSFKGKKHNKLTLEKMSEAQLKRYELNPPTNVIFYNLETSEKVLVNNLRKFCREHGLSHDCMYNIIAGKAQQHKNWALSLNPERNSKAKYQLLKDGEIITINNLLKFCRENNLQRSSLLRLLSGKQQKPYKGYTKYHEDL